MKTKVCHMTSAHNSADVRIFHKECVSLAKAGYDVTLVARGESREENGVRVVGVGQPGGRLDRMTAFARKVYRTALEADADIYHFHDPELLPYGLKLKKKGKKVVFDSHERYTEQLRRKPYLPRAISESLAFFYGFYEKHCLKKIDAVIFPCTMRGVNPFEGLCRKTVLIDNVALLDEFYNRYDENHPKVAGQVCYAGGLTEGRGITMDINAVSKIDGATLALAGEFSSREYLDELKKLDEFSCVDYRGKLNREKMRDFLAESQAGLSTLLDCGQYFKADNLPTKVYEYMAMGLPVVLSNNEYNKKTIDECRFGICVDPENPDEIAEAIRYILDHPEEARKMGENGRRLVKEKFNWGIEEKKLLKLYEDLSSGKHNQEV